MKRNELAPKSLARIAAENKYFCSLGIDPESPNQILTAMAGHAHKKGMRFKPDSIVTVVNPSLVSRHAIPMCFELKKICPEPSTIFRPGHIEFERSGAHRIPSTSLNAYESASHIVIVTDVIIDGSIVSSTATMIQSFFQDACVIAMCIANHGQRSAKDLNVHEFHSLI